jgi:hypothetical protein
MLSNRKMQLGPSPKFGHLEIRLFK